jgi:hypothetical protein
MGSYTKLFTHPRSILQQVNFLILQNQRLFEFVLCKVNAMLLGLYPT